MTLVTAVGLCTIDVLQRVEEHPIPGEKVQSLSVEVTAGGPATNAAVAIAALGGQVTLITALGNHPLAHLAKEDLKAHGVTVEDTAPTRTSPPPISAVTVRTRDGERTVVSHNAQGMTTSETRPLNPTNALLLDGHHPTLALAAARAAKAAGIPVILDAGSWKPTLPELLPYVDVVAASAAFPQEALSTSQVWIVTNGPSPVKWSTGKAAGEVRVPRTTPKNTAGAGDVWHGALTLAVARTNGVPTETTLPSQITYANEAATTKIQHEGARSWTTALKSMRRQP